MPQWCGLNTPSPAAPSADLLGSPVSRGALSQIGKRSLSSGSGRRHAWDSRPTKRYIANCPLPKLPSSVEDGCGIYSSSIPTLLVVCVRCSSEPAVWVPDREDRASRAGRSKQAAVCVVSAYERTGSGCGAEFFQPDTVTQRQTPRAAHAHTVRTADRVGHGSEDRAQNLFGTCAFWQ